MISTLYIDGVKLDQFKDENISVISSVLDIKDITKNTTDYTRSFTVPASRLNNQTFSHYYDFNIDDGFDARKKIDGEIHLDGIVFREGKWRLQKVNLKKGKPESYTINFFGHLVGLKDKASDLELSDLDLSAYDHDYDSDTVYEGLTGVGVGLANDNVIYNLFAKKQYYFNNDASDNVQTDTLANIAYINSEVSTGIKWNDLKPSLKLIRILEAIETDLGVTFSRDFFGTTEFNQLYMWLNPNKDKEIKGNSQRINWTTNNAGAIWMNLTTDVGAYPVDATTGARFHLYINVYPNTASLAIPYKIKYYVDDELHTEIEWTGNYQQSTFFVLSAPTATTYNVYFEIEAEQEFTYTAQLRQKYYSPLGGNDIFDTDAAIDTLDSTIVVSENIPKIKIIDFLKGIFQMFKLVIVPTGEDTYYVNDLNGFYSEGTTYDITKYIDWNNYDVSRGEILNEIKLKFKEPKTILNIQFEQNTGTAYGDEELRITENADGTGDLVDGDSLTVELPFEQIVYERLVDLNNENLTNIIYGAVVDEAISPVNPDAHIHYNKRVGMYGNPAFITDTGARIELNNTLNIPLHGDQLYNPNFSTVFGEEYNEWDNAVITNTLYSNHYEDYIESIFNIKKRTTKFTAYLPLRIITKLALNDNLFIKNNYYKIDKFSSNLLTGEVQLELVNSFETSINSFKSSTTNINTDYTAKTTEYYITNLGGSSTTFVKTDLGDGTAWVTVATYETEATAENVLTLIFTENTTEDSRNLILTATQAVTGAEISIYIVQDAEQYIPSIKFSDTRNSGYAALLTLRN